MQGGNKKMDQFIQYTPTEVVFGKETENQAGAEVKKWGGTKVLVVYGGGSAKRSGLLDRVEASLAKEGLAFEELGGVKPNPRLALAEEGVKKAVEMQADFILAVGGGSSIDTAKAVAHGAANPPPTARIKSACKSGGGTLGYLDEKSTADKISPGRSGSDDTGSRKRDERFSRSDKRGNRQKGRHQHAVQPLQICHHESGAGSNPAEIPDCLRSNRHHDAHDGALFHSGEPVRDDGRDRRGTPPYRNQKPKVLENPSDYNAMAEIMWCGSLSHNGLTECGRGKDFSVHKFGHALSAKYDVAHGASLAAVWGAWAKYQYDEETVLWRFARFAEKVWGITEGSDHKRATEGIERTVAFFHSLGMPTSLHELDIPNPSDEDLRALSMDATQQDTVKLSRIRKLGAQEVYEIYQMAR